MEKKKKPVQPPSHEKNGEPVEPPIHNIIGVDRERFPPLIDPDKRLIDFDGRRTESEEYVEGQQPEESEPADKPPKKKKTE